MSDGFRKVRPGEPVRVAAQAWNKIIDQVVTKPRFDGNTSASPPTNFRVRVRNNTSTGISRWGVLQISDILEAPTGVGGQFEQWPGVIGGTPASGPEGGVSYVVAVDPIPAGSIGQGAINGVVQSRVLVLNTGHQYAKPKAGEVDYLETADSGPFRIIWKGATGPANPTGVTGPTKPWALLSFGGGSSGSAIRIGQFSGNWYNEPGESGADNVKLVKLYVQPPNASGANDWIPELDGNSEEVMAVTLNLFSYIPTRSGNDSYMWCAVQPLSDIPGEYWTGGYDVVDGEDVPIMRPYSKLWLLMAAEC